MIDISRRDLARYGAKLLADGQPASAVAQRLAKLLVATGRHKDYQLLADDIAYEQEMAKQHIHARVTTAHPLTAKERQKLSAELKKLTNTKHVSLEETVDSSLIGGARVQTATHSWDNSIATQLSGLSKAVN